MAYLLNLCVNLIAPKYTNIFWGYHFYIDSKLIYVDFLSIKLIGKIFSNFTSKCSI